MDIIRNNKLTKLLLYVLAFFILAIFSASSIYADTNNSVTDLKHVYGARCNTYYCRISVNLKRANGKPVPPGVYLWQYRVNSPNGAYSFPFPGGRTFYFSVSRAQSNFFLIETKSVGNIGTHESRYEFAINDLR